MHRMIDEDDHDYADDDDDAYDAAPLLTCYGSCANASRLRLDPPSSKRRRSARTAPPLLLPGVWLRSGFPGRRRVGRHLSNRAVPRQAKVARRGYRRSDTRTNSRTEQ